MICEDDVKFKISRGELDDLINQFILNPKLSVLCLGYNNFNSISISESFFITSDTQTASCYILKPYMKSIFINSLKASIYFFENKINFTYRANDQLWKVFQEKYFFAIPKNRGVIQSESYSDTVNKIVNYQV